MVSISMTSLASTPSNPRYKLDKYKYITFYIRRAPHELFLKKGVLHQFSSGWGIFLKTSSWLGKFKVHLNLKLQMSKILNTSLQVNNYVFTINK